MKKEKMWYHGVKPLPLSEKEVADYMRSQGVATLSAWRRVAEKHNQEKHYRYFISSNPGTVKKIYGRTWKEILDLRED